MPTSRLCIGCGRVAATSPCSACRSTRGRARDARRGSRHERGYGAEHEKAKQDPAYLAASACVTCGRPFTKDNPKTGGHVVALRRGGRGSGVKPECRDCNYGWQSSGS